MSVAYFNNHPVSAMKWGNRDVLSLAIGDVKFWEQPSPEVDGYQLQSIYLSDGAYFELDYHPNQLTQTKAEINPVGTSSSLFGLFGSQGSYNCQTSYRGSTRLIRTDEIGGTAYTTIALPSDELSTYESIKASNTNTKDVYINGELSNTGSSEMSVSGISPYNYFIGTYNSYGEPTYTATEGWYGNWQIREYNESTGENDSLFDLVPWLRTSDNVAGFYNTLTGKFLEAVTGTVTAGEPFVIIPSVDKNYYSFMTEVNDQYYLDVIPEVDDEGLNIYDSELNLIATDGTCNLLTISKTDYLAVQSSSLSLYIVRWSDNNDIINT